MKLINIIFFSLGLTSILIGIPLTQIIANNNNFLISNNYFREITIFFIILIFFLKLIYDHYLSRWGKFFSLFLIIIFFQIINFYIIKYSEFFFNDISKFKQIIFYLLLIFSFIFLSIKINKKLIDNIIRYLSILFFFQMVLIFINSTNSFIKNNKISKKIIEQQNNYKLNNIILIIFDELSLDFIIDENGKIKSDYDNLKKFSEESIFFNNAYSSFDFTSKAMLSLLTYGHSIESEIINNKSYYFKHLSLFDQNLYKDISKTHNVNVYASYDYCHYHAEFINNCVSNINNEDNFFKSIKNYIYFFYLYSAPRFIINELHNRSIINKDGSVVDYFTNEKAIIDNFNISLKSKNNIGNFYIMHTNITHQPWVLDKDGNIDITKIINDDDKINNIDKLKRYYHESIEYSDIKFGSIINFLKDNGQYQDALIIFTSDHGVSFDKDIFLRMNGKLNDQISKVPLMIKIPDEKKGNVNETHANIIDIGSTIINFINKKDIKFKYSKNLLNEDSLNDKKIPFLSVKEKFDLTGKINYIKNIYCKNNNHIYELKNEKIYSDILNICNNN